MISPETCWQQARTALASDDYDTAMGILEGGLHEADIPGRARLWLYLASVHSLYGEAGMADMEQALKMAWSLDPASAALPLSQSLHTEVRVRQSISSAAMNVINESGLPAAMFPDAILPGPELREAADPLARFHAFCALMLAGRAAEALDMDLPAPELPEHLRWRLRSWQADAQETLGQTQDAALLYGEAAHLARGQNRAVMLQEQAALQLNLGQPADARHTLEQARMLYDTAGQNPDDHLNLATWYYLNAQALLQLGQPEQAHNDIQEAARLEKLGGESSYGVALVRGQVLSHLGQPETALDAFEEALRLSAQPDRPYANHELGVALLDLDRPVEAREKLEAVLAVPDYPYHPEVLADLAECDYRLGRLAEAQQTAEQALAQGAVIPASLVLGSVALEYYHLDEALEHYERVVREAAQGSRDWVVAHQMAADVLAQQGFTDPARAFAYAQQALAHTPESDDWHVTLQEHLRKAQERLGSNGRMLN